MTGITVITTGGSVYEVPNATPAATKWVVGPAGELAVEAYVNEPGKGTPQWLASFGSVEVVAKENEVNVVTPAPEESAPAARPGSWA